MKKKNFNKVFRENMLNVERYWGFDCDYEHVFQSIKEENAFCSIGVDDYFQLNCPISPSSMLYKKCPFCSVRYLLKVLSEIATEDIEEEDLI